MFILTKITNICNDFSLDLFQTFGWIQTIRKTMLITITLHASTPLTPWFFDKQPNNVKMSLLCPLLQTCPYLDTVKYIAKSCSMT